MGLSDVVARQLGDPSGFLGRLLASVLDRANRSINAAAIESLDLQRGHTVLDVGFGGGVALHALLARTEPSRVVGVERSQTMLDRAQRRFTRPLKGGRLELFQGDAAALPLEDDSVQRALSVNTIYFWPQPIDALGEIRRVLAPGGRLVIATEPGERLEGSRVADGRFPMYSDDELADLLASSGFVDTSSERRGGAVITAGVAP